MAEVKLPRSKKNGLKLLGFFLLEQVVSTIAILAIPYMNIWSFLVCCLLEVGIIYLAWRFYQKFKMSDSDAWFRFRDIAAMFLYWIVLRLIVLGLSLLMIHFYGNDTTANDAALQGLLSDSQNIFAIVTFAIITVFVAPVCEEIIFRAGISKVFFKPEQFYLPLFVSSAIFALIHGPKNILSFLMYFSLGVGLFLAYRRRNNIKDAILLHFLNNGVAVMLLIIAQVFHIPLS